MLNNVRLSFVKCLVKFGKNKRNLFVYSLLISSHLCAPTVHYYSLFNSLHLSHICGGGGIKYEVDLNYKRVLIMRGIREIF